MNKTSELVEVSHPADPKDNGGKVPGFTYAWMIPYLTRVFRKHGYACCVHGSMSRDLDVVAVPWVEQVSDPEVLLADICKFTDGHLMPPNVNTVKPHGRTAHNIVFNGAWHFIDVSIMPAIAPPPPAASAPRFVELLTGDEVSAS